MRSAFHPYQTQTQLKGIKMTSTATSVQPNDDESRLMTPRQAAAFLGFSLFYVHDHVSRKEPRLPFLKVGQRIRFQRRDLLAFIETLKVKS